ncbi:MAG: Trm112 family protein [Deltaproteobacteria bacterium]|nr:Trm112 family protein [Deltaproteobacteria bacterium]
MDEELLKVLVCPSCKGSLVHDEGEGIVCESCKLAYPIKDGIPVMLVNEAKKIG